MSNAPLVAGRYEFGPAIGAGAFATVFRGRDRLEARDVALKVMPFGEESERHFERFRAEALTLARLKSRYIARVFDFGRDEAVGIYLVMELVDGVPLAPASIGRALLPHEVLRMARALLEGLAEAHAAGVVHRDIKPSNVLVAPERVLDGPKLLDFGVARSARREELEAELGLAQTADGALLGTPAFMAPEQIAGDPAGPAADVYAAGLVLFDLLGMGPLFPGATVREQMAARLAREPELDGRVPPPLSRLLARMLAREPRARFPTAGEAWAAVVDLETADPRALARSSSAPPGRSEPPAVDRREPTAPGARDEPRAPKRSSSSWAVGARRLTRLADDAEGALREALAALDLGMIDALARRERGGPVGRIARALALALRLELDAAALVLEPLAPASELARGIAAALIAPRARKVTRARVDTERADAWAERLELETASMLASLGAAMSAREDAARADARCARVLDRHAADSPSRTTLAIARLACACHAGRLPKSRAVAEARALRDADAHPAPAFDAYVRAVLVGTLAFRADERLARERLEHAARLAADTGATLLEARALVAWGGLLVEVPGRVEQGLGVLERAATLLAHGDAPSLEHVAEHNRGVALLVEKRYAEAAPHFRRAREAARGEDSAEHAVLAATSELFALLALGDRAASRALAAELSPPRLAQVSARTASFARVARALGALAGAGLVAAEEEHAHAVERARAAEADAGDVELVCDALGLALRAARGTREDLLARAEEIQRRAHDRGFFAFYWFDVAAAALARVADAETREACEGTLARLAMLVRPSVPPPASTETPRGA